MLEKITDKLQIFKKVKLKTIIILIILFSFNSYAWFLYATRVSSGVSAHVSSWNVNFRTGEDEIITNIDCVIDRIYPGMTDYVEEIRVYNSGETNASLDYEIVSYTLLGNTYSVGSTYTSDDLIDRLENNYPFTFNVVIDSVNLNQPDGFGAFSITVSWPYESGNDALDTQWGENAYTFFENNPTANSLEIELRLLAVQ